MKLQVHFKTVTSSKEVVTVFLFNRYLRFELCLAGENYWICIGMKETVLDILVQIC